MTASKAVKYFSIIRDIIKSHIHIRLYQAALESRIKIKLILKRFGIVSLNRIQIKYSKLVAGQFNVLRSVSCQIGIERREILVCFIPVTSIVKINNQYLS